jgi:integrase
MARRTAWIAANESKNSKAIAVPLTKAAMVILLGQIGGDRTFVFTYRGNPLGQPNILAWSKALKRAGIEDFRWHDLWHTRASWHVQAGTPLRILQGLGGWESVETVLRYSHLSSEHLAEHAERMSGRLQAFSPSRRREGKVGG